MTDNIGKSAGARLLAAMVSNPEQPVVALTPDFVGAEPVITGSQVDQVVTAVPIAKTSKGEEITHRLAVLTYSALQRKGRAMCFNAVHDFVAGVTATVPMSELGLKLQELQLTNIANITGKIAEAAIEVCVDHGIFKPIIPVIQTRRSPSVRGPR